MIYLLIPLAFLADRLGKWWAAAYLAEHGPTRFNALFTLVETHNRGIAFGLFQGIGPLVGWVLERREFSRTELAAAFPERRDAQLDQLLRDLGAMRLTEPL